MRRRVPDARFLVIGDGAERDRLEQRARALDLGPALRFLGHQEDIPALLHGSDIFVLPSRSEAFPNALLEAMAQQATLALHQNRLAEQSHV